MRCYLSIPFLFLLTCSAQAQSYAKPVLDRLIVRANGQSYDISRETATAQPISLVNSSAGIVARTYIFEASPALTAPVFMYAIDGASPAHSVQVGQFVHQPVGGNKPFKPTQKSYTTALTLPTVLPASFKGVPVKFGFGTADAPQMLFPQPFTIQY